MSQQKRKRVVPTIQQKIDIIKQLDEGISVRELALKYNIGSTTVHDVKKNRDKLLKFSISACDSIHGINHRRTMKKSPYELLHKAMLQWFNCERAEGRPVTGPMCVKQAKVLFETLGMKGNFDASSGWLARFKDRHGIRTVGDSMDCLWTRSKTEKGFQSNESNMVDYFLREENSLNGSVELPRNNPDITDKAKKSEQLLESSVQTKNAQDALSHLASINSEEEEMAENIVHNHSNSAIKNYINLLDLSSIVKKLEAVSEKLATSDNYDQFGTYITSLLRRLPQDKALMLKQNIVNDVLDAIIEQEKGLDENPITNANLNNPLTNERSEVKRQKHSFTFVSCNTPQASSPPVSLKKPKLRTHSQECCPSKGSSESLPDLASQTLPDNTRIRPSTGRPAAHTVRPCDTSISQERHCTVNVLKTIKRVKARKPRKKQQTNSSNNNDVADYSSNKVTMSCADDVSVDFEEGRESRALKKDENIFEVVFCEDDVFVQVKEEPQEQEPAPEPLAQPQVLLCDLCEMSCFSSTELVLHFSHAHTGCVPMYKTEFGGSLT